MKIRIGILVLLALVLSAAVAMAESVKLPDMSSKGLVGYSSGVSSGVLPEAFCGEDDGFVELDLEVKGFIWGRAKCFPAVSLEGITEVQSLTTNIERKHVLKSLSKYTRQFMVVKGKVTQALEMKDSVATGVMVEDASYDRWMYLTVGAIDVFEGDSVTICGMPVVKAAYKSKGGSQIPYIALLGGYISK